MSNANIPQPALWHLQGLARERYNPEAVHAWYRTVLYGTVHASSSREMNALVGPRGEHKKYACYRCWGSFSWSRDLIRHVDEICEPRYSWRCPECNKVYNRESRFRSHHQGRHHCSRTLCSHADRALQRHQPRQAHGCGFCVTLIEGDLELYLKHLITHFDNGSSIIDWDWTIQVFSLLRRQDIETHWQSLCAARFGIQTQAWPALQWSYTLVHPYVSMLEGPVNAEVLRQHLPRLLHLGLQHLHTSSLTVPPPLPSIYGDQAADRPLSTSQAPVVTPRNSVGRLPDASQNSIWHDGDGSSGTVPSGLSNLEALDSLSSGSQSNAFALMGTGFDCTGHRDSCVSLDRFEDLPTKNDVATDAITFVQSTLPSAEGDGDIASDDHLFCQNERESTLQSVHHVFGCSSPFIENHRRRHLPSTRSQAVCRSSRRRSSEGSDSTIDLEHD